MTVRDAFRRQGKACDTLGSAFMARLMPLIADRLDTGAVADRVLNWQGDPMPSADSVPLRLAGALHALKIQGAALGDVYPPHAPSDNQLWSALETAMQKHAAHILSWLDSPPQTNEVRRAAPLAAALSLIGARYARPVELLEIGCSAGLNLRVDHFAMQLGARTLGPAGSKVQIRPDWQGPAPTEPLPAIVQRCGVDLRPIDPLTPDGRLKLLAYLWPDQSDRITRTEAAIQMARTVPAQIDTGDAAAWLERKLSRPADDRLRVVFHTVAWQYFPEDTKARAVSAMQTSATPVVQFGMENDGGHGASLTLTHHPTGEHQTLGRADFHGRWVEWAG